MTTGADKQIKQSSVCVCCGHDKATNISLCTWCYKDNRKYALFELIPAMQEFLADGDERGFCKCCANYNVGSILIDRFLAYDWCRDLVNAEKVKGLDNEEIATIFAPRERKALMDNRCTCIIDACDCCLRYCSLDETTLQEEQDYEIEQTKKMYEDIGRHFTDNN